MKIAIIAFSVMGANLGKKISQIFEIENNLNHCARMENNAATRFEHDNNVIVNKNSKFEIEAVTTNERAANVLPKLNCSLSQWVGEKFAQCELLIFVGACGIAVRKIAPFIVDKKTDPAVLVVDDNGKNVISLLSGHLGGGNQWTTFVANKIGANAVITTASDCNGKIAIDMFAKKNNLVITDFRKAKEIESALLDGEKIVLVSEFPLEGKVPHEISVEKCREQFKKQQTEVNSDNKQSDKHDNAEPLCKDKYKIQIGLHNCNKSKNTLFLVPKCIVAGVGCKKGKTKNEILDAIEISLKKVNIPIEALSKIASIDIKANEEGLLEAAAQLQTKIVFYSADELIEVEEVSDKSDFVKSITGVDNVCERAAILGSVNGKVLLNKTKLDGITVALAIEERSISFE